MKYKALHVSFKRYSFPGYQFNSNLPHSFLEQKLTKGISCEINVRTQFLYRVVTSHRILIDYPLILLSGILWAIGIYGAVVLMKHENFGTGQGLSVAPLWIVVNAPILFKTPKLHSKSANLSIIGVLIAAFGEAILGYFVNKQYK